MAGTIRTRIEIDADTRDAVAGLEDVEQAATDADTAVERLDGAKVDIDVDTDHLRRARQGIDELGRSADSSKSVLANMVGNTTQDLGALGGVAGTAGVAIGQMGEYMADAANSGESMSSVLRNFGSVAIPIAGVTGAMWALSRGAEQAADRTADLEEATDKLTSATDENVLAMWTQMLMRAALDGKNLDDQLRDLAETNVIGARRMLDLTVAAGGATELTDRLAAAIGEADRAAAQHEETMARYGDTIGRTTGAIDDQTGALAAQADELDGVNARWREYADVAQVIVGNVLEAARFIAGGGMAATTGPAFPTSAPRGSATPLGPQHITIINPPGTPATTVESTSIYVSRNGVRTGP